MAGLIERVGALFDELRRRRVFHAAVVYLIVAWAVVEAAATVLPLFFVSESVVRVVTVLAVLGFPVALVAAWLYDLTPKGLERSPASDSQFASHPKARFVLLLLAVAATGLAGAAAWALWLGPWAAVGGSPALDPARVAVLYFDDHSEDGRLGYLAEGFTESLIHELTQIHALKVVSRNGVKPFRDTDVPPDSIARVLKAGSLVEGSLEGNRQRLVATVQLVDGRTGDHRMSRRLERSGDDLLALRDDIVRESARLLSQTLGEELAVERVRSSTDSPEAWDLMARARSLMDHADTLRWTLGDVEGAQRILGQADSLLARAERLDPDWPEATLARAEVKGNMASSAAAVRQDLDTALTRSAIEHLDRLLKDHPRHAEALALRGNLRFGLSWTNAASAGELRSAAEADLRRALALDPGMVPAWVGLADLLRSRGDFAEASVAAERALEEDPFLIHGGRWIFYTLAHVWLELEDLDRALRWNAEGMRRYPVDPAFAAVQLAILAGWSGADVSPDSAWAKVRAVEEGYGIDMWPHGYLQAAAVLVRAGRIDSAESLVERVRATSGGDPWLDYYEANVRVQLGQIDRALDLLERFLTEVPSRTSYIAEDWWWRPLRDTDRFQDLVSAPAN